MRHHRGRQQTRRPPPLPRTRTTIARITRLDLRARQVVEGFISGMHKSPFFGHSVEFVQHREYTPGDDIRHLDWKVWSKTDRFYIKQYEAETNLRCHARRRRQRVDALRPRPAEQVRLRLHRRRLPGLPAPPPAGRRRPDHVRRATCARSCPPRSQQTHLDAIVKALHVSQPREKTDIEKILRRVAENAAGPRHGRASSPTCSSTASRCSTAWRCSGTAGTTSWSSTSSTTTS